MSRPTLTERQEKAWPEAMARLVASGAAGIAEDFRSWDVVFHEEVRPGRGHFVNATYVDGEVFAQVLMDVYGSPSVSFATLDWVHADENEECDAGTPAEVAAGLARALNDPVAAGTLLTDTEHAVIRQAGDLWNALCQVVADGPTRDADLRELIAHVHAIQHAVMAQAAARAFPALLRPLGGSLRTGAVS